jgi:hypothetical protein
MIMRDHEQLPSRRFGAVLLLAGLLYWLGAAADPIVHAMAIAGDAAEVETGAPVEGPEAPSAPHNDLQCLLCKLAGPVAPLSGVASPPFHQATKDGPSAAAGGYHSLVLGFLPPARAPPIV